MRMPPVPVSPCVARVPPSEPSALRRPVAGAPVGVTKRRPPLESPGGQSIGPERDAGTPVTPLLSGPEVVRTGRESGTVGRMPEPVGNGPEGRAGRGAPPKGPEVTRNDCLYRRAVGR